MHEESRKVIHRGVDARQLEGIAGFESTCHPEFRVQRERRCRNRSGVQNQRRTRIRVAAKQPGLLQEKSRVEPVSHQRRRTQTTRWHDASLAAKLERVLVRIRKHRSRINAHVLQINFVGDVLPFPTDLVRRCSECCFVYFASIVQSIMGINLIKKDGWKEASKQGTQILL